MKIKFDIWIAVTMLFSFVTGAVHRLALTSVVGRANRRYLGSPGTCVARSTYANIAFGAILLVHAALDGDLSRPWLITPSRGEDEVKPPILEHPLYVGMILVFLGLFS